MSDKYSIHQHNNVRAFLDRAESWLVQAEAEYNLFLGIANRLLLDAEAYKQPVFLATVENETGVAGCVIRTPPHKLLLTRMPVEAVQKLVDHIATIYPDLPAVIGSKVEATRFAELWASRHSCAFKQGMKQGIYLLDSVSLPHTPAPGCLRQAKKKDFDLVQEWRIAFAKDVGMADQISDTTKQRIESGEIYLWEDEQPCSMACGTGKTPNGIRIGGVYTPAEFRGRGYASICVAELSRLLLNQGQQFCFLYTDPANPTSNAIYRRIGYRQVCEVVDIEFS